MAPATKGAALTSVDLVKRELSPVDHDGVGDATPQVGIARHLHPVRIQVLGQVLVKRL